MVIKKNLIENSCENSRREFIDKEDKEEEGHMALEHDIIYNMHNANHLGMSLINYLLRFSTQLNILSSHFSSNNLRSTAKISTLLFRYADRAFIRT